MAVLHELVHIQRINRARSASLSGKIKWAYGLHEEFRADYEALQVANEEEIEEFIITFEKHLDWMLNGGKKETEVTVQVPNYQITLASTFSHTPKHPTWAEKLPSFIQPYAKDSYFNLNSSDPHPPIFIRLAMARCALFYKRMGFSPN